MMSEDGIRLGRAKRRLQVEHFLISIPLGPLDAHGYLMTNASGCCARRRRSTTPHGCWGMSTRSIRPCCGSTDKKNAPVCPGGCRPLILLFPRCRPYMAVHKITPIFRVRQFVLGAEDAETDLPEMMARAIWETVETPQIREHVTHLRTIRRCDHELLRAECWK